ncbi:hypothetical protein F5Y12DRAFT_714797 [Xylaria sp. FL1777]|nr:hypothetical protein F5Y12DRAFT_714797 [Xylaria sp. FL1777]
MEACDVVFTIDRELIYRHDQCDLHMTTNIVATSLGVKCTKPFTSSSHTQLAHGSVSDVRRAPTFGKQAILLDETGDRSVTIDDAVASLTFYKHAGVRIVAPSLLYLVSVDAEGEYAPSNYATMAGRLALDILM